MRWREKNGAIKFLATDFKQMSAPDFCNSISKFLQTESFEKDEKSDNYRPFKRNPDIKPSTYTSVAKLAEENRYKFYNAEVGSNLFAVARRDVESLSIENFREAIESY